MLAPPPTAPRRKLPRPTPRILFILLGCTTGLILGLLYHKTIALPSASITPRNHAVRLLSHPAHDPTHANPFLMNSATTHTTGKASDGTTVHTIFTSDGSPYLSIQSRILYGTFKLVQSSPGGKHLTGFTRILHRSTPDVLMHEIPTFHTQPIDAGCDQWCEFPVVNRPIAVRSWLDAVTAKPSLLQGDWILLLEGDFTWMRPLQPPSAHNPAAQGWGFEYTYMVPENYPEIMVELNPGGGQIPKTGPAPMMLRPEDWRKVTPLWVAKTQEIEKNPTYKKVLGWIREMYAFDIALAMAGVKMHIEGWPTGKLMVHLPFEPNLGEAAMVHYTYGTGFAVGGKEIWQFNKRAYHRPEWVLRVPRIPDVPPYQEGMVMTLFAKGEKVTRAQRDSMADMIRQMNAAIDQLPEIKAR